jgi:hypothetical protein
VLVSLVHIRFCHYWCCVGVMVVVGDEVVKWRWGVDVVTFGVVS